jgi:fructose-bisphosphate aldolase, class I
VPMETMKDRIAHVMQCCFNGKRLVVFSGGESAATEDFLQVVRGIRDGGGSGSIVGRNSFQRPKKEAMDLLGQIIKIYKNEA